MYFAYQKIHEINWLSITNESYAVHPITLLSSKNLLTIFCPLVLSLAVIEKP